MGRMLILQPEQNFCFFSGGDANYFCPTVDITKTFKNPNSQYLEED